MTCQVQQTKQATTEQRFEITRKRDDDAERFIWLATDHQTGESRDFYYYRNAAAWAAVQTNNYPSPVTLKEFSQC